MSALDFPDNPVDGEVYGNYQWDDAAGVWNLVPSLVQARFVTSPTAPLNPQAGDAWFNSTDAVTYIYYDDGDSAQWVQSNSPQLGFLSLDALTDVDLTAPAADDVLTYDGTGWVNAPAGGGGFTNSTTITATNSSWPVPALGSPIIKVTVVGGGGGGGGGSRGVQTNGTSGGSGGTTTFNAGTAGTVSASGGGGGNFVLQQGAFAVLGLTSGNGGGGGGTVTISNNQGASIGGRGSGGNISIAYLDMTGVSTVDVTIGAGGAGGNGASQATGGRNGGRGEVIVEYVAA